MVETHIRYDLLPETKNDVYLDWTDRALKSIQSFPGLLEIRANRNLLGSPLIRVSCIWDSLDDWTRYQQSDDWRRLDSQLRSFVADVSIEIRGPSPILKDPVVLGGA